MKGVPFLTKDKVPIKGIEKRFGPDRLLIALTAFFLLSEITLNSSVFDVKYISNSYIIRSNVLTFWRLGVQESHPVFRIL